jgi:ribonuclease J
MHFHPELPQPPALEAGTLRLVALGGLGEVGRNMHVLEYDGRLLIIDCGVLFPEDIQPGVDLILPDFGYLDGRLEDIEGIVLTHGHEDHIGAVPYLLRRRQDIPLIGSQLTLAFIEAKLKEHRIQPITLGVKEGQRERLGAFDLEFVAVNHSIPDALAVFVRTPAGTVLNTGDFKMDQLPLDGRITDLRSFARMGEEGVDLFQVDSTNAEVPGFTTSEVEIGPTLDALFARGEGRIEVASFAPRSAGVRRCGTAVPSRGAGGAVHGAQHGHRLRNGLLAHPRGHPGRPQAGRRHAARPGGLHVHWFARRAHGGAEPHREP